MSELLSARNRETEYRWQLLTTVSALALLAAVFATNEAKATDQDADRPTIWIELGGQLGHVSGQGDNFPVGFLTANPNSPVLQGTTPLQAQNPLPFSFAEEGKISFQPESSDWLFSAAVNIGRSSNFKHVDHQTNGIHYFKYKSGLTTPYNDNIRGTDDFADTRVHHRENHAILDFSVGKDVGLGIFGRSGSSIINLGVRFAQFTSEATFDVRARPDLQVHNVTLGVIRLPLLYFHTYHATGDASRSFHGIGPSLSWNGSTPFAGTPQHGEVTFDWGANAALLFGRQRANVKHHESGHYKSPFCALGGGYCHYATPTYQNSGGHDTDHSVIVPNVGGFASASYRIENFKVSLGYRADFFFGAIDGGIDVAKKENRDFYGPFATISVGVGG
jgi:iron complex outermembrane recepter protein